MKENVFPIIHGWGNFPPKSIAVITNPFKRFFENSTSLNCDCSLHTKPINVKPPPVTAEGLEFFEQVSTIFSLVYLRCQVEKT